VYLQNNTEIGKCALPVKENERLESKRTVTQLCCDAFFGETVKVKLDHSTVLIPTYYQTVDIFSKL